MLTRNSTLMQRDARKNGGRRLEPRAAVE